MATVLEKRERYLPDEPTRVSSISPSLMRAPLIGEGILILDPHRGKSFVRQLHILLSNFALNGRTPTTAELIKILHGDTSKKEPTKYQRDRISSLLSGLRTWLSEMKYPYHLIVYVKRAIVEGYTTFGKQSVITPILTKRGYKPIGSHINRVAKSCEDRDKENLRALEDPRILKQNIVKLLAEIEETAPLMEPMKKNKRKYRRR